MNNIHVIPSEELQIIELDYKRAFGELSFFVGLAWAFDSDDSSREYYLKKAFDLIERVNNSPHFQIIKDR